MLPCHPSASRCRCRETLLALAREYQDAEWVIVPGEKPKVADAVGWIGVYVNSLIANSKPRAYVKELASKTWDMTVWLQHYWDATEYDAELVLGATQQLLRAFNLLMKRHAEGPQERCPKCDSYRVVEETGPLVEHNKHWGTFLHDECIACGWKSEPVFEQWERDRLKRFFEYMTGEGGALHDAWEEMKRAEERGE